MPPHQKRTAPHLTYGHIVCDNCEGNVNTAFDILFGAVMERRETPVENLMAADRSES
jgi:hypothetical protein